MRSRLVTSKVRVIQFVIATETEAFSLAFRKLIFTKNQLDDIQVFKVQTDRERDVTKVMDVFLKKI